MDTKTIYPTNECFDDAIANLIHMMERGRRFDVASGLIKIVHAIIEPHGEKLSHAWLEDLDLVFFSGFIDGEKCLVECAREEYYEQSKISHVVRYTLFEAYAEEKKHGHYGPWDEKIRRHLRAETWL